MCTFLTAWGDVFFLTFLVFYRTDGQFYFAFSLGWLAAPLTHLLLGFVVALFRRTPILAGGIGIARLVVGFVFCLFWVFGQLCVSDICLLRDWARCRAALGAKKGEGCAQ